MTTEWAKATAFYDKMMDFALWLEEEKDGPARFKQTINFLLAHLEAGDVPEKITPVACSRGMFYAPPAQNNEEGG